jgi:hypothetical protein
MQATPNYQLRRTLENILFYLATFILVIIAFPAYWLVTTAFKYEKDRTFKCYSW